MPEIGAQVSMVISSPRVENIMQQNESTQPKAHECPRCGYALHATMIASEARGENVGACTECGLAITWSKFCQTGADPLWFLESRRSVNMRIVPRAFMTLLHATLPHHFWSRVTMSIPLAPRRFVVFFIVVALALYGSAVVGRIVGVNAAGNAPRGGTIIPYSKVPLTNGEIAANCAVAFVAPFSRQTAQEMWEKCLDAIPETDQQYARALLLSQTVFEAIVLPYRGEYIVARYSWLPPHSLPYGQAPIVQWRPPISPDQRDLIPLRTIGSVFIIASIALAAPLCMLLLPQSLRRARVRRMHFARMTAYSTALAIPLWMVVFIAPKTAFSFDRPFFVANGITHGMYGQLLLIVGFTALVTVWTHAIARDYLKLPHALGVAISCSVLAMLLAMIVLIAILRSMVYTVWPY